MLAFTHWHVTKLWVARHDSRTGILLAVPQRLGGTERASKASIATVCLSGGLDEKLLAIANAGFTGVHEIFENDLLSFNGTPRISGTRQRLDLGLDIVTFQPFRDFEGMPAEKRERNFTRAERKFDLMQELGCELLMVCSNVSPESIGGIDRAAEDFSALGERAAQRGMRVGFEALAWGRHINDYRDAWEVVRRADHPSVGLVLDSFHILSRRIDLRAMTAVPRDRIFLVQLADAPLLEMDYLSWSRHFRNFPGQGDFPMLDFMAALHQTGYDGLLSLEIFNDQFRAGSPRSVAIDGHRSLIHLLDQMHWSAPPLPPRACCLGCEFIEFALDEASEPAFSALLRSLGFARSGEHISKSVTRWTQGGINLVANTEKEGFAHSYYITHGAAVCALGLRVDDAAATLERARGLLDQPFQQAVGPGELEIPAVRGVGGSLIYFTDPASNLAQVWDIEFAPTGEPAADAGLTVVDHISQSMHYEEMLTWLLFYSSLLNLDKKSRRRMYSGSRWPREKPGRCSRLDALPCGSSLTHRNQSARSPRGSCQVIRLRRAAHQRLKRPIFFSPPVASVAAERRSVASHPGKITTMTWKPGPSLS